MKHIVLCLVALCMAAVICYAEEVTLAWDRNKESKVIGYKLYYEAFEDVGNKTIHTLNLEKNKWYKFSVTAYTSEDESGRSESIEYVVPNPACDVSLCHGR